MIRRQPDLLSLLFGVFFAGIGITVIAGRTEIVGDSHWVWPAVLVAVGAIMLAATIGSGRRHHHGYAGAPAQPAVPPPAAAPEPPAEEPQPPTVTG